MFYPLQIQGIERLKERGLQFILHRSSAFSRPLLAIASGVINKLCCGRCTCNAGNCLQNSSATPGCIQEPPASHKSVMPCPSICRATMSAIFFRTPVSPQAKSRHRDRVCTALPLPAKYGDFRRESERCDVRRWLHPPSTSLCPFHDGNAGSAAADIHYTGVVQLQQIRNCGWLIQHMAHFQSGRFQHVDGNTRVRTEEKRSPHG